MTFNDDNVSKLSRVLGFKFEYSTFPVGSMFWFRPEALNGIEKIGGQYFDAAQGLSDSTVVRAVERLFCSIVDNNNYMVGLSE